MNNNQSNTGFLIGLLIGVAIGGGLVFLLATKKGKKILKSLAEEGMDSVSELEELFEDAIHPDDGEIPEPSETKSKNSSSSKPKAQPDGKSGESPINRIASSGKRFFRRIPKRS